MPSRGTSVVMQESRLTKSPTRPIHIPWSLCSHLWGGGAKPSHPLIGRGRGAFSLHPPEALWLGTHELD